MKHNRETIRAAVDDTFAGLSIPQAARKHGLSTYVIADHRSRDGRIKRRRTRKDIRRAFEELELLEAATAKHCPRAEWSYREMADTIGLSHEAVAGTANRALLRIRWEMSQEILTAARECLGRKHEKIT